MITKTYTFRHEFIEVTCLGTAIEWSIAKTLLGSFKLAHCAKQS
jgi:hypothetical protein